MPTHPDVSALLKCKRCTRLDIDCDKIDKGDAKCSCCTNGDRACEHGIELNLLQHFRTELISTLVQESLIPTFLHLFDRYYRRYPLLLHASLAFAALEKAPRQLPHDQQDQYHKLALNFRRRTIASFLAMEVDQHTWRPYYLSYLIYAPFSLQLCCSTVRHDLTSEISQNLLGLRGLFARLNTFKADLDADIFVFRLWSNPVTWGQQLGDDKFDNSEPVKLLNEAIDSQILSMEVKQELKVSVEQLYRIINSIMIAQKGNFSNPGVMTQNNDKALFIWMSLSAYSDTVFDSILAGSDTGAQHIIWRTILCHYGFAFHLRSSSVWYFEGIGEKMLNEWLKLMRDGKHLSKDGMVKIRNAMTIVAGKMGITNWEDEKQWASV